MEFLKLHDYIKELDSLIRQECTGTASEFAQKLGVSERTLYYHLNELKLLGVEIVYDPYQKTYRYTKPGRLFFGFTNDQLSSVKGGFKAYCKQEDFLLN